MPATPHSPSWDDFRLVKAIADTTSLVGAAEVLAINHSTVFRRLGSLEETLGTRLFERSRNGYAATAAGEEMIALANRMAHEITEFERKVAGRDVTPAGELRVTTNDTMLVHLLTPIFASFAKACPDIRLEIIIGNQSLNLSKRDADIAIRATTEPPETLVGRRIRPLAWCVYGHADSKCDAAALDDPALRWVGYGDNLANIAAARKMHDEMGARNVVYRVNTVLGLAEAVAADIGLGFLPCFIGDKTPGIKRIGKVVPELGASLWLLTHPDLRHSARIRAFMDHAGAELMKRRKLLHGE